MAAQIIRHSVPYSENADTKAAAQNGGTVRVSYWTAGRCQRPATDWDALAVTAAGTPVPDVVSAGDGRAR